VRGLPRAAQNDSSISHSFDFPVGGLAPLLMVEPV
jgi:hypothetical protein